MSPRLFDAASPKLQDFQQICSRTTDPASYRLASTIERNVPIYDATNFDPWDTSSTITTTQLKEQTKRQKTHAEPARSNNELNYWKEEAQKHSKEA